MELCWCGVGVVSVDDGGGSGVVGGVGCGLLAVCVGDGGVGGCVLVVCFPMLGGGGVFE